MTGVEGVLQNWEKLKEKERRDRQDEKGLLDGVPAALPALNQAQEYQERAARVGFDWPEIEGVLDKIAEEVREVQDAETPTTWPRSSATCSSRWSTFHAGKRWMPSRLCARPTSNSRPALPTSRPAPKCSLAA